jgi:hypothetical protein
MRTFERIFLYSVLIILVFCVFLVDNNVGSQVAIQEEIRARGIMIVNTAGQKVAEMYADKSGNGTIVIYSKDGIPVVAMGAGKNGGTIFVTNKDGALVGSMP